MPTETYLSEEVADLVDLAKQLAGACDRRGEEAWHWPECLSVAAQLLLVRELKTLRHQLRGEG